MAFTKYDLTSDAWTLIGEGVTSITFQNIGQWGIYLNFNSSNAVPTEEYGLLYEPEQRELKRTVSELTYVTSANHVFARSISKTSSVVVETA